MIPDALRINDCNGSPNANAQTIGFGAIYQWSWSDQVQFLEAVLQVIPGFEALFFRSAFGFGLVGAEKNVTFVFLQTQSDSYGFQVVSHMLRMGWARCELQRGKR